MVVHWIEILRVKRPQITWRSLFITPVGGGSIPQIPLYTPGKGQRTAYWVLSPQVEEDVDRIQTLLKETFYFNYFIDNLISYFTLVFTFICMYTYKHPLRTMYLYSKSPFGTTKYVSLYLLTAISEILVYAIFISVVLLWNVVGYSFPEPWPWPFAVELKIEV